MPVYKVEIIKTITTRQYIDVDTVDGARARAAVRAAIDKGYEFPSPVPGAVEIKKDFKLAACQSWELWRNGRYV